MSNPDQAPPAFFDRADSAPDAEFYAWPRLVTHIDDRAIAAVRDLYTELGLDGDADEPRRVLDLMSSWTSHLASAPAQLVVLGMNQVELDANQMATKRIVQDLNTDPRLPLADSSVDGVLCCVSVDYLIRPVEVLAEAARVLRPGAPIAVTFSNRCFPSKAIRGWLATDDDAHGAIIGEYLRLAGGFTPAEVSLRTPGGNYGGDPLWAVVSRRLH
ncbi:MAG: methyltransferase domain-containing protein [Nakamurella sp.]